jgi:hypothetical protein
MHGGRDSFKASGDMQQRAGDMLVFCNITRSSMRAEWSSRPIKLQAGVHVVRKHACKYPTSNLAGSRYRNKRFSGRTLHVGSNIKPADVELWVDCRIMIRLFASMCK